MLSEHLDRDCKFIISFNVWITYPDEVDNKPIV